MIKLFCLLPFAFCLLAMPDLASAGNCPHREHDRHCARCCPPPRTITVTNTVRITNTVIQRVEVRCPSLSASDVTLHAGHSYRLVAAVGEGPWQLWGIVRPGSNTAARIYLPAGDARPILWQLVDWTPGHPRQAVELQAVDCETKPTWIALGKGRVLRARP